MPTYDYFCDNDKCSSLGKEITRRCKIAERNEQCCETCGELLVKEVSSTQNSHVSWSTWRVDIGIKK